jgi:hypothetical protein
MFHCFTQFLIVLDVPDFRITSCSEACAGGMGLRRKKAAGKDKEEEMKYTVPGNPVDSFCTPLYTSLHEIVDQ